MLVRRITTFALSLACAAAACAVVPPSASASPPPSPPSPPSSIAVGAALDAPPPTSKYVPLAPARVLDTRVAIGAAQGPVGPGGSLRLTVLGQGGVPASNVTAVVVNITLAEATGPGFVQATPTGVATGDPGATSTLNLDAPGQTSANLAIVPLGVDGTVTLYTQGGGHLLADVFGYFTRSFQSSDGRFQAVPAARVLDTRQASDTKLGAASTRTLTLAGRAGVPANGASAVVLGVVATDVETAGYVQVIPHGGPTQLRTSSNLNVGANQTVANLVVVPLGSDGAVQLYTQTPANLVVDVYGWFTDANAPVLDDGLFVPLTPQRLLDTRSGAAPAPMAPLNVAVANRAGVPSSGAGAVFANITATQAASAGWVQAMPGQGSNETGQWSNLDIDHADQTVATATIAALGNDGSFSLVASTQTHLLVDIAGYMTHTTAAPGTAVPAAPDGLQAQVQRWSNPPNTEPVATLHLRWSDHADNETGYRIEQRATCAAGDVRLLGVLAPNTTEATVDVAGVVSRTNFCESVWVVAYNGAGESAPSNAYANMFPVPAAPSIAAYTRVAPNTFDITFTDADVLGWHTRDFSVQDTYGTPLPALTETSPGQWTARVDATLFAGNLDDLRCTTVWATNGRLYATDHSASAQSAQACLPDAAPEPPPAPTVIDHGDGNVTVGWRAPLAYGRAVTAYEVRVVGSASATSVSGSTTSVGLVGLTAGASLSLQVRAQTALGWSGWSNASATITVA